MKEAIDPLVKDLVNEEVDAPATADSGSPFFVAADVRRLTFPATRQIRASFTSAATNFESALRAWLRAKLVRIFLSRQASR